jgi:hypothetical protein
MASRVHQPGVEITHPNREKAVVRATRACVLALVLATVAMLLVVTIGGEAAMDTSALLIQYLFVAAYLLIAYLVVRWSRGALAVGSALAVLLAVFALVGGAYWFQRDHGYFSASTLDPTLLGTITFAILPIQILLIVFAMRGFQQGWNVELERAVPARTAGPSAGASAA